MKFKSVRIFGADKALRKKARELLPWAMERLITGRMASEVKFILRFKPDLVEKEEIYGQISIVDDAVKPRHFEILLDSSLTDKQLAITIFHELVHAKQYLMGELQDFDYCKLVRWKRTIVDPEFITYWKQPWEKEAFRRADKFYREYAKFKKKQAAD